jgi:hypothetical protein
MTTCKNCDHNFEGNFCYNCGQTAHTHEIDFKSIVHEIQHSIFHFDKGILYTTKELFSRPGDSIRAYIEGKRVKHFKPFAYVLFLSAAYYLLAKLAHKSTFLHSFSSGMLEALTDKRNDQSLSLVVSTLQYIQNNYAYSTLLMLPIVSLASYLAFLEARYNYFQHLVLNAFIAGQRTVAYMFFLLFSYFVPEGRADYLLQIIVVAVGVFLTFWPYFQFFRTIKPSYRILLTLLTYILEMVIFLGIFLILALMSSLS